MISKSASAFKFNSEIPKQDCMIDPFPYWDSRYLELAISLSLVSLVNGALYKTSFESVVSAYVLSSSRGATGAGAQAC